MLNSLHIFDVPQDTGYVFHIVSIDRAEVADVHPFKDILLPCNKVAYAFALAAMDAGNYMPMAANFIGSMAPPLAIAVAALVAKKKFTKEERAAIPGLFAGAFGMITEFAIPFAAANPLTVIPSLMAGS